MAADSSSEQPTVHTGNANDTQGMPRYLAALRMDINAPLTSLEVGVENLEEDVKDLFARVADGERAQAQETYDRCMLVIGMLRRAPQRIRDILNVYDREDNPMR